MAILFGSYARGEADEYSDIDLLVVANSMRPFVERFKDFGGIWQSSPVKSIDMFVYTQAEFEQMQLAGNPFVLHVVAEGKVIYEAGSEDGGRAVAAAGGKRSGRR